MIMTERRALVSSIRHLTELKMNSENSFSFDNPPLIRTILVQKIFRPRDFVHLSKMLFQRFLNFLQFNALLSNKSF